MLPRGHPTGRDPALDEFSTGTTAASQWLSRARIIGPVPALGDQFHIAQSSRSGQGSGGLLAIGASGTKKGKTHDRGATERRKPH